MSQTQINIKNIPVQAEIISDILNLDIDSSSSFHELHNFISADQGVASLVLRAANSSFYNRGNKIATIPLAVGFLGYGVVRSLALLAFSRSLFAQTGNALFGLHIWQHSLLTAIASQTICRELGNAKLPDEAFVAGLMHDIGKVLMFTHNPVLYENVFKFSFENNCMSTESETKYFGFDHHQIGQQAVDEWKLPVCFNVYMGTDLIVPQPEKLTDVVLQSLIAGHYLVKSAGIGANPISDPETQKAALLSLGLSEALCEHLLQDQFITCLMEDETYRLFASK
jgi:hypothetical protein